VNLPPDVRLIAGAPPTGATDADILILALDRAEETLDAIASALAQTGLTRHVIVLDQGSAPAMLQRLSAAIAGRDDAMLLTGRTNRGVAGGRNLVASVGRGRILIGLDNDATFADADVAARAVAALDSAPRLAALGFRVVVDATGEDDAMSWGYPAALRLRAGGTFLAATFVGCGHAIRRAAWDDAGGYDEALFFTWEEYDFCLRAIDRGWQVRYRGDLVVRHKVSPTRRVAWGGRRWRYFVRNRLHIERKWGASWPALAPRCLGYLAKGLRNGVLASTLAGIGDAVGLDRSLPDRRLSPDARAYLAAHDGAHRGDPLDRLRREVLAAWPGLR
jgi:GT2 family glycosyltransferase